MKFTKSFSTLFTAIAATGLCVSTVSAAPQNADKPASLQQDLAAQLQYVLEAQDRYIIKFKEDAEGPVAQSKSDKASRSISERRRARYVADTAATAVNGVSGRLHKVLARRGIAVATMGRYAAQQLSQRADVESVTVDPVRKPMAQTVPYGYTMINAQQLNQPDTSAMKVCVIDTGISAGHEDLPNQNNGLTGDSNGPAVGNWYNDGHGHGTHVAGTIAAYDNGYGSIGVYPGVNLHVVKIFDDNGGWTYASNLVSAIDQCVDAGAKVVNMSLGGGGSSSFENNAMQQFEDDGILLVAAAGNAGNTSKSYPASYDSVVSVAAVGSNGTRAWYSQHNDQVEIAAPGSGVYSTGKNNNYRNMTGTSMATPHVSGAAALLWSFYPQCSNKQIRDLLNMAAVDKGDAGRDNKYGHGLLDVEAAYNLAAQNGCNGQADEAAPAPVLPPVNGFGDTITGLSGKASQWVRETIEVPAGLEQLTFTTSGGEGNANLYVREGKYPYLRFNDCKSEQAGTAQTCTINAPEAGTWHVALRSDSGFDGVTLTYSSNGGGGNDKNENMEETYTDLSAAHKDWNRFTWEVPAGTARLTLTSTGGTGNANLFARFDRQPMMYQFDCRSWDSSDNEETCVIESPQAGTWHLGLRAREAYSGVTFQISME
ncbi:S8 family serine peptidase [Alteromonas sp. ASW11-19]|uniref:S8 family serine peptidase n=1 Tax=Alteromonas salexigens TaxID=2982530 RepID=A0ABT2VNN1_9ALTE|nr:S8 family serine peptidase [Alteromonas salexigens]MCU7554477.1 S8 family serine peptidase [Alteromonas salexigens]